MENGPDNQKTKDEERRISDQCAYESWLQDKHPCEDGVRSLLHHIEECANTAIQPSDSSLPAEEIETLEFCISELRPCFDDLTKWLIDPLEKSRPYQREVAFEKLWGLIGAAFRIGVHATLTKGAENYFRPIIKREALIAQAELAAREKKKNDAPRLLRLDAAIRAEMEKNATKAEPAISLKYAQRLRPGVLQRLGRKDGWPSPSTIKGRIASLKKVKTSNFDLTKDNA